MKILYSQIKELIPGLKASAKSVSEALTLTGIMVDKLESVDFNGKPDFLLGLEVRQNRPDCLGVIGVAREVAAYYGLPFKMPVVKYKEGAQKLSVIVEAKPEVKRAVVVRLSGMKNQASPEWLQNYLAFYGINSINLIVDLSNYAMIYTGFPNHVFDAKRVAGALTWKRIDKDTDLETLDGTILSLQKGVHLVIADTLGPLVLASAVGGRRSAVSLETSDVLIEVAVYDGAKLLNDARSLNVVTEAGSRLQKDLATAPARFVLDFLVQLYIDHAGATVTSKVSDTYLQKPKGKAITMAVNAPTVYGGIEVPAAISVKHLKHLGFAVKSGAKQLQVVAPDFRTDIHDEADLVEEVLRMNGFDKIPSNVPPLLALVSNVTPPNIRLIKKLRDNLAGLGLDEVYTLPLTTEEANTETGYRDWEQVRTQNSINEEFPVLRTGLATGLLEQQKTYVRKNVEHIRIFEIGTVYGRIGKTYRELEVCALLIHGKEALAEIHSIVSRILLAAGAHDVTFAPLTELLPATANPFSIFEIRIGGTKVGVLYKLIPQKLTGNSYISDTAFAEFDIPAVIAELNVFKTASAEEVLDKLVVLDATVETSAEALESMKRNIREQVGNKLWAIDIVDSFKKNSSTAYTFRISYIGLDDSEAKALHEKIFA